MKIDLNKVDRDNFLCTPHIIGNTPCVLIRPVHIGVKFNNENKVFRSSLWGIDGELISAGLPKFTNWGENPENFPVPTSLKNCQIVSKIDGSQLIFSYYQKNLIVRTRGTVDASKLEFGHELEILKEKYSKIWDYSDVSSSLILEWVSPAQRIVIDYGPEPDLYLIAKINHSDYSLESQNSLDSIALELGVKRPEYFRFETLPDLLQSVQLFKNLEGVCLYSNNGQTIHKIKAEEYLNLHRFKENATLESTLDLFVEFEYPLYPEFEKKLIEKFDYECFNMVRRFASAVCDAFKQVKQILDGFDRFVVGVKILPNRKAQAEKIIGSYGETNRAGFVFKLLDGKGLDKKDIKKLLWQCLKK